jgi:hypothetical protein
VKRLSKQFLLAKKNAYNLFLRSILKNEGKGWTEFYKYVKKVKITGKILSRSKVLMDH